MSARNMRICVTGAAGFVGQALVRELLAKGYLVVALVRHPEQLAYAHPSLSWYLGDVCDVESLRRAFKGCDYIVHLAGRKNDEHDSAATNEDGMRNVISVAAECKVRGIVNLSTMSARLAEAGVYGQTKRSAASLLSQSSIPSLTLYSSLIYGEPTEGITGTIARFAKLPFVPIIGSGEESYRPLHVMDIASAIEHVVARGLDGHTEFEIGGPDAITFNELTWAICEHVRARPAHLMHLPRSFVYAGVSVVNFLHILSPLTRSNVLATYQSLPVNTDGFNLAYNFKPRSFKQGLDETFSEPLPGYYEAAALLRYVVYPSSLKRFVAEAHVQRYLKVIADASLPAHSLPRAMQEHSWLLGSLDLYTKFFDREGIFQKKVCLAAAIVEASPLSASWLLPKKHGLFDLLWSSLQMSLSLCINLVGLVPILFIFHHKFYEKSR